MIDSINYAKRLIALIAMAALFIVSAGVSAAEQVDAAKSTTEFQVDIPIGADDKRSSEELIRGKLLSEKLIKMGRARSQGCTRCHGRSGMYTMARAAGWDRSVTEFVVIQLTDFREGKRSHAIMSSVAKPLSDQDIALIAAWYQSVSPVPAD